jgi:hypothetical protein
MRDSLQVLRLRNAKIFDNSIRVKVLAFVRLGIAVERRPSRLAERVARYRR